MPPSRKKQLINALAAGVHAGQLLAAGKNPSLGEEYAQRFSDAGDLAQPSVRSDVIAWTEGGDIDPGIASKIDRLSRHPVPDDAGLPFHVLRRHMRESLPDVSELTVDAIANLGQLCLDTRHDGGLLQDLFALYTAMGLDVDIVHLGLRGDFDSLAPISDTLARDCDVDWVSTTAMHWNITLQKIANWGEVHSRRRDKFVLADELLRDDDVQPLIETLKTLPVKCIGILGHSMTMSLHWTTYASWCDMAAEAVRQINPGIEYADFQAGGLTPTRAISEGYFQKLIDYKPTETYILLTIYNETDQKNLETILTGLQAIGSVVHVVDDIRPWAYEGRDRNAVFDFIRELCAKHDAVYLDFYHRSLSIPDVESLRPADGDVHMYTPGHIFFAKELLKYWVS